MNTGLREREGSGRKVNKQKIQYIFSINPCDVRQETLSSNCKNIKKLIPNGVARFLLHEGVKVPETLCLPDIKILLDQGYKEDSRLGAYSCPTDVKLLFHNPAGDLPPAV